jgi:hypothetical protein
MDNAIFKVNGDSIERLVSAIKLMPNDHKVLGYKEVFGKGKDLDRLVFYWTKRGYTQHHQPDVMWFPAPITAEFLASMIMSWIELRGESHLKERIGHPGIDGDVEVGWLLECDAWGQTDQGWDTFMQVSPAWIMYGK